MVEEKLIYKYFRISEFLFDLLISNQLYFSNVSQFNDPYDCHFAYEGVPTYEEFDKFLNAYFPSKENHQYHIDLFNNSPKDYVEPILNVFKSQLRYWGICCFTPFKNNFLMWSHYADSHKGVCLGFSHDELIKKFPQSDIVDYKNEPYFFNISNITDSVSKAVLRKSLDWEYEKEIRFIIERNKTIDFPKSALREINFGLRCSTRQMLNIVHLTTKMQYTNCKFLKADIEQSKYSVTFNETDFDSLRREVLKDSVYIPFTGKIAWEKESDASDKKEETKDNPVEPPKDQPSTAYQQLLPEKRVECKGSLVRESLPQNYTPQHKLKLKISFSINVHTEGEIQHTDIESTLTVLENNSSIGELVTLTQCQIEKQLATVKTGVLSVKTAIESIKQLLNYYNKEKNNNLSLPTVSDEEILNIVLTMIKGGNV